VNWTRIPQLFIIWPVTILPTLYWLPPELLCQDYKFSGNTVYQDIQSVFHYRILSYLCKKRTNLVSHFIVLLQRSSESGYSLMTTEPFKLNLQTQTQTLPCIWLVTYFLLLQANSWSCCHFYCRKTTGKLCCLVTLIKHHSHLQFLP
jgi:hypothetical protein